MSTGFNSNGNDEGLFSFTDNHWKDRLPPTQDYRPTYHYQLLRSNSSFFEDVEEVFSHLVWTRWSKTTWSEYPAKKTAPGRYQLAFNAENIQEGTFHLTSPKTRHAKVYLPLNFRSSRQPALVTQPDNYYPVGECTWAAKSWLLGHKTGGNGGMWAAGALRASGPGNAPGSVLIACWDNGGYGHVAVVTEVEHHQKIQVKELITMIGPSTISVAGLTPRMLSGERSAISIKLKNS